MEHAFRQLQFDFGFLATLRTRLARVVWRNLMEMLAVALGNPFTPIKEHTPRCIGNAFGKVSVADHVARFEFLSNDSIKVLVMENPISRFSDKVEALAGNNIRLFRE